MLEVAHLRILAAAILLLIIRVLYVTIERCMIMRLAQRRKNTIERFLQANLMLIGVVFRVCQMQQAL
jgi:hypothetical protein